MVNTKLMDISGALIIFKSVREGITDTLDQKGMSIPASTRQYLNEKLDQIESVMLNDYVEAATENVSVFNDILNWQKEDPNE